MNKTSLVSGFILQVRDSELERSAYSPCILSTGCSCVASWNSVAVLQYRDNEQLGPYGIGITMVIATQLEETSLIVQLPQNHCQTYETDKLFT
jgi:hypothetical protein